MTDQLNEARPNDALILRAGPALRPTMEDFRAAMDEMERSYRTFQQERAACWQDIAQAPMPREPFTVDMIYEAIREISEYEARRERQRLEDERRMRWARRPYTDPYINPFGEDYPGSYCYCSPSRGMLFGGQYRRADHYEALSHMELIGNRISAGTAPTVTHNELEPRWEAEPVVPSKELAVIPKPVLDPVEVIPAPKRWARALLGCGALAVIAFIVNVAFVFIH